LATVCRWRFSATSTATGIVHGLGPSSRKSGTDARSRSRALSLSLSGTMAAGPAMFFSLPARALLVLSLCSLAGAKKKKKEAPKISKESYDCQYCEYIAKHFMTGIQRTKTLAKYNPKKGTVEAIDTPAFINKYGLVESRFDDIMNGVCNLTFKNTEPRVGPVGKMMTKRDPQCEMRLEDSEDHLRDWWMKKQKKIIEKRERRLKGKVEFNDLNDHLCNDKMKKCCPRGFFGPDCKGRCKTVELRICNDHGVCVGGGTRAEGGKCKCEKGFTGAACIFCKKGYREVRTNSTGGSKSSSKRCVKVTKADRKAAKEAREAREAEEAAAKKAARDAATKAAAQAELAEAVADRDAAAEAAAAGAEEPAAATGTGADAEEPPIAVTSNSEEEEAGAARDEL